MFVFISETSDTVLMTPPLKGRESVNHLNNKYTMLSVDQMYSYRQPPTQIICKIICFILKSILSRFSSDQ